jgi:hypothetical protein
VAEIRIERDETGRPFLWLPTEFEPLRLCFVELLDEWAREVVKAVRRMERAKTSSRKAKPRSLARNYWSIEVTPDGAHFEFVLADGSVLDECDLPLRDLKRAMSLLLDVRTEQAEQATRS